MEMEGKRSAPGPADVRPPTHPVRVTEELKRAAKAGSAALASLHPDDFAEAHIGAVSLKYDGIETAQAVAKAAAHLAKHLAERHWQMEKVRAEVEAEGKRGRVNLPWELLLPEDFNTLTADVAKTELELLEVEQWLVEAARLFCATFPTENLIRIDLVPSSDEGKSPGCVALEQAIPALLMALREFAAALAKASVTGPYHVVTIAGTELCRVGNQA